MDIDLAWTIVAFFLGLVVNRWNEDRRHEATAQAAREQEFEAMQRQTWVSLQDALSDYWKASTEMRRASEDHDRMMDEWLAKKRRRRSTTLPPENPRFDTAAATYFVVRQRANTLCSRVEDDTTRAIAESAILNISQYQAASNEVDNPPTIAQWTWANEALEAAIARLGELSRQPPQRLGGTRRRIPWRTSLE